MGGAYKNNNQSYPETNEVSKRPNWSKADHYEPDPAKFRRGLLDRREPRTLEELTQWIAFQEPMAREILEKIERGQKVYKFERAHLANWNYLRSELARKQKL